MKIFFDLDGTLIDVLPRHFAVYSELVAHFGGNILDKEAYWNLKRDKVKWPVLLRKSNLSPGIEADFLEHFRSKIEARAYLRMDVLFLGVEKKLHDLSLCHELYLVSLRRNHKNLLWEIDMLGLRPLFKDILSGHSETDGYDVKMKLIGEVLGSEASALVVGDTEADIITARELGLRSVAVGSGIRSVEFLQTLRPNGLLPSVSELEL